jgi:hypothetical protein
MKPGIGMDVVQQDVAGDGCYAHATHDSVLLGYKDRQVGVVDPRPPRFGGLVAQPGGDLGRVVPVIIMTQLDDGPAQDVHGDRRIINCGATCEDGHS